MQMLFIRVIKKLYLGKTCQHYFACLHSKSILQAIYPVKKHANYDYCKYRFLQLLYENNASLTFFRFEHSAPSAFKKKKALLDAEEKSKRKLKYSPKVTKKTDGQVISVWNNMTVKELANAMGRDTDHVFEVLSLTKDGNRYSSQNSRIDNIKIIQAVVKKSGLRSAIATEPQDKEETFEESLPLRPVDPNSLEKRPPIVTIMGHVDHGKTSLLDTLRHSSIVSQEFGGITQHIGAFSVTTASGEIITFLDTPGHAAFSAMRERGAMVTDIVVLVVAADDGVMEQTIQSIKYANDAKVPIIVAINKIDKPGANIEQSKKQLLQQGLQLEDFGGDVQTVPISATKNTNLEHLIDSILTQAELMDLKADPKTLVQGTVIESRLDPIRGKLCTALIQQGTLRKASYLVGGVCWAKVRSMFSEGGNVIHEANPSLPVEVIGWKELPSAGDKIYEVLSEKQARQIIQLRLQKERENKDVEDYKTISEKMQKHVEEYRRERELRLSQGRYKKRFSPQKSPYEADDPTPKLQIVLKGDVDGSVDALLDVLETYNSPVCKLDIIHFGVGAVTITDVELATMFKGVIYAFNVSTHGDARQLSQSNKIALKHFNIIYKMIDDVKEEINSRLPLKDEEQILGEATVLQEFLINEGKKKWPVAGCQCVKGTLKKEAQFRVLRGDKTVSEGTLESMRHLKNEVNSIKKGVECGLRFADLEMRFNAGDTIQCYQTVQVKQKTDWNPGF